MYNITNLDFRSKLNKLALSDSDDEFGSEEENEDNTHTGMNSLYCDIHMNISVKYRDIEEEIQDLYESGLRNLEEENSVISFQLTFVLAYCTEIYSSGNQRRDTITKNPTKGGCIPANRHGEGVLSNDVTNSIQAPVTQTACGHNGNDFFGRNSNSFHF